MRESEVEAYLISKVKELGGLTRKLKWVYYANAPDRLVAYRGQVWFVELKAPGKVPRPGQAREHERMRDAGMKVCTLNTEDQVQNFIRLIRYRGENQNAKP